MKKLGLKLDDLSVESFETHAPAARRGTVLANAYIDAEQGILGASGGCSDIEAGTYTCDRRCEPSIVNCTTIEVELY